MSSARGHAWWEYVVHGLFWSLYGLVKYFPSPLGDWLRYLVAKPFMKRMGRVRIAEGVTFWNPYRISLGDHVTLNEWTYIVGYGGVEIGDWVRIAHRTSILSVDHAFDDPSTPIALQGKRKGKITIGDDVWIGCGATILKGVTIGDGAIIGAGAVVTDDVPPRGIAIGSPARVVEYRGATPKSERQNEKLV